METRKGRRTKAHRLRALPGKAGAAACDFFVDGSKDIVCHYGVVVQCTSVEGLELVEFEFLPDAA